MALARHQPPLLFPTILLAIVVTACGDSDGRLFADRRPPDEPPAPRVAARHEEEDPAPPPRPRAAPSPTSTAAPPRELLPDLEVMPPRELYIEGGADLRKIRFSTTVVNTGEGPLDIEGVFDPATNITTATQRVYRDDGEISEHLAGRFMFHAGHAHWHFEDFTVLELWSYRSDGSLDELKATTGKATFCAVDEILEYEQLPNVPEGAMFFECGQGVQGISVGYSDTYTADLIGQELDITHVPDGRYAVRTVVDPAGRLRETNDDNNDIVVFVDVRGSTIELRDGP